MDLTVGRSRTPGEDAEDEDVKPDADLLSKYFIDVRRSNGRQDGHDEPEMSDVQSALNIADGDAMKVETETNFPALYNDGGTCVPTAKKTAKADCRSQGKFIGSPGKGIYAGIIFFDGWGFLAFILLFILSFWHLMASWAFHVGIVLYNVHLRHCDEQVLSVIS